MLRVVENRYANVGKSLGAAYHSIRGNKHDNAVFDTILFQKSLNT